MMYYDHAMLGAALALGVGAGRRQGWPIVAMAAVAAMLPDWDDLSTVVDPTIRRQVHRVWGHALVSAIPSGALLGAAGYLCWRAARGRSHAPSASGHALGVWALVGMMAAASHLVADVIYSAATGAADWPVALLWPFARQAWAVPLFTCDDRGATAILGGGLLAVCALPSFGRLLAWLTLATLVGFVALRGLGGP